MMTPRHRSDGQLDTWVSSATGISLQELAEERDRIARELHDVVVQRLFLIGLQIARIAAKHEDRDCEHILDELDQSIGDLRAVVFALRRPRGINGVMSHQDAHELSGGTEEIEASDFGRDLIAKVIADLRPILGREIEAEFVGEFVDIPDELLTECGLVARELIINAHKHSNGTRIWIRISSLMNSLSIVVEDDGDGVRTLHPAQGGTGLRSLAQRAERNGGHFRVAARKPNGTAVRWTVPRLR